MVKSVVADMSHHHPLLALAFILLVLACTTGAPPPPDMSTTSPEPACYTFALDQGTGLVLSCTRLRMGTHRDDVTLPHVMGAAVSGQFSTVTHLQIRDSNVPYLNLPALTPFTNLIELEITRSRVRRVNPPNSLRQLKSLNLSHNYLPALDLPRLFESTGPRTALHMLDLSYNLLTNITLSHLPHLRVLALRDNNFTCRWVRNELYDWWSAPGVIPGDRVLLEANATLCAASEIAFDSIPFPVALSLKARGVQECEATACSCDVRGYFINKLPNPSFPNVYSTPELNVTITLKLDCGNMNLTELPSITPFATVLSVQHNAIQSLDRVSTDPNYRNIVGLDLRWNALESIEFLSESRFTDNFYFQFIVLQGNRFHSIPEHIISGIFKETRKSLMRIRLGENQIDCDCFTHTKLRPLLIRHEKVIDDWRNISCRTPVQKSLLDLKGEDVCSSTGDPSSKPSLDLLWYSVIAVESLLIVAIITKVWIDARRYRATGRLPRCSLCIPRLPCDFMLEGLKESKQHGNGLHDHHNGHHHGSRHANNRRQSGLSGQSQGAMHATGTHRDSVQSQKLLESHA